MSSTVDPVAGRSEAGVDADVRRVLVSWALLVGVTIVTTWVLVMDNARPWVLALTFALVALKVLVVLAEFMELRAAPLVGRLVFGGWAVAVAAVIVAVAWT